MSSRGDRPNILIYCTDQQRADLLGCAGHAHIRTPNIDALAARGTRLRNLFIQGTVCMPSRYSIMTSQYPSVHGVTDNGFELPYDTPTMGSYLSDAGYHTAIVGRTHLRCSLPLPTLPNQGYYGWDESHHTQCYWPGLDREGEYQQWVRQNWPADFDRITMAKPVDRDDAHCASWWDIDDSQTMTAWVTDKALETIGRHRYSRGDQPFCLWAGTWDPHMRFTVPEPWASMYDPAEIPLPVRRAGELDDLPPHYRRLAMTEWKRSGLDLDTVIRNTLSIYCGTISHIDDQFGRLMRGLSELGVLDNTIVVFMSDHGELAGDHWCWTKGPYWFDSALRVPGIIACPGQVAEGAQSDALVETIDLLPTLLDYANVEPGKQVQGRSIRALLRDGSQSHREDVFTEYMHHDRDTDQQMFSLRTMSHRVVCYPGQSYGELYDYTSDPHQLHNRWHDAGYADVRRQMVDRLHARYAQNLKRPDVRVARW